MNSGMIARQVATVLKLQAILLLFPLLFCLLDRDRAAAQGFFVATLITTALFLLMGRIRYDKSRPVYLKDSFVLVAVCWIAVSFTGALPYWLSGEIPFFLDALFESVSGFTTTGASILPAVEDMPRGLLFWRSFSHWIGGMGVLVFLLAVVPAFSGQERSMAILSAESPGPIPGKLVPRLRRSAGILYLLYLGLTILELALLLLGGMPLFDSLTNAFATAGTGGFAVKNASIAAYNSVWAEGVITIFMVLFGINFNIFYYVMVRNFTAVFRNEELRAYLGLIAASTMLITWNLCSVGQGNFGQAFRFAAFQVASIITSTGFASADFDLWPTFSKMILFLLMFIGASAGSTGGGLKVSRMVLLYRESQRMLRRVIFPRQVESVLMDGKKVDSTVVHATNSYFFTFMLIYFLSFLIVSIDGFGLETTMSATIACLNNIGPGFGIAGPTGSFADFSALSKIVLVLDMLLGRLELYPLLLLLSPRTWRRA